MKDHLQRELIDIFGERVAFVAPGTRRPKPGSGMLATPDAVVRPLDAGEARLLALFSHKHGIPLVPRGAATGNYGGSEAIRGGIVVDFTAMNRVLALQPDLPEVTVEPGITWRALEWHLQRRGLSLRIYPSSGAVSTVGGWVAAGGVGIGSYRYGPVDRNVSWVDVILPDGNQVRLSRDNLQLVVGTQGIVGMITAIGLPVRQLASPETVVAATFRKLPAFLQALRGMHLRKLPLWHVSLVSAAADDETAFQLPLGPGGAERFPLTRHTAVFAFADQGKANVSLDARAEILSHGGIGRPELCGPTFWEDRWHGAGLGLIGPATANGAVMLPAAYVDALYRDVRRREWPIRMACNLSSGGWTAARCLSVEGRQIPEAILRDWLILAKAKGARPYGVDPGDADQSIEYLAPDLHDWLLAFKRRQDPGLLMNPGKLLVPGELPAEARTTPTLDKLLRVLQRHQPLESEGAKKQS